MPTASLAGQTKTELQDLITKFELAKDQLVNKIQEIRDEWSGEIDDRTETWQESEPGQKASERLGILDGWIDDIGDLDLPDLDDLNV